MGSNIALYYKIKSALFGLAIGDALGVPAEFKSRELLKENPVKDFEGYKSHNQPPGTFSDDSSLAFCLAESLCKGYDLKDLANRFVKWQVEAYWTANEVVFDIGITTYNSIRRLITGCRPELAGEFEEDSNGNGSLMRIMPLLFHIRELPVEKRYRIIKEVSSLTHAHIRSVIACFYYLEYALLLMQGRDKFVAYKFVSKHVTEFLFFKEITDHEISLFDPLLKDEIIYKNEKEIPSSGYVLHTLKASIWCFLNTNNYEEAVLKAVNLGGDTDTTACVTGGLAGLYYGFDSIPGKWKTEIRKANEIEDLSKRLYKALSK